jgi:HSP20 family protein
MLMRIERHPAFQPAFRSIFGLGQDFNGVLDSVLCNEFSPSGNKLPALDVLDQKDATVVFAELPGVTKDQITISLDKDVLTIGGERKPTELPENSGWIRSETLRGKFSRSIKLTHPVKNGEVSAELTNGILRVVLPKAEEARPREITIK